MKKNMCKSLNIILSLILITLVLASCGKKEKVDYVYNDKVSETQEDLYQYDIPEKITYDIEGAMAKVNVDADIILPDKYEDCPVVEFTRGNFTDEDIKKYADIIFDKGSYFLFMPYSEEQLEFLVNKLTNIVEEIEDQNVKNYIEEYYLDSFKNLLTYEEGDRADIDGDIKFYEYMDIDDMGLENTGSDGDLAPTYICELVGTINGKYYMLTFKKIGKVSSMVLSPFEEEVATYDVGNEYYEVSLGNNCTYSKAEAEKIARDYVEKLGISDMVITRTSNVMRNEAGRDVDDGTSEICGYSIYFGKGYEGYSLVYSENNYDTDLPYYVKEYFTANENNYKTEFVQIYVDNNGISGLIYVNPLQEGCIITENTVLLPFEAVKEIADIEFQRYVDNYKNYFYISEIQLGYGVVGDGDKIALVPVWYFFTKDSVGETNRNFLKIECLSINAIDGSVIYSY